MKILKNQALCRGDKLRKAEYDDTAVCQYLHFKDPFLMLGPFKFEELNPRPFVAIFHDFLSENEMDTYISFAANRMRRSEHSKERNWQAGHESGASFKRTSKTGWLSEFSIVNGSSIYTTGFPNMHPTSTKISVRIRLATKMNVFDFHGGEAYQIANYGLGGQYSQHLDAGKNKDKMTEMYGPRIQTFMAYLSDVEGGGATVFPNMGLTVWPKKGDAITWYNMHTNGEIDSATYHGGCPVIKGSMKNSFIYFSCFYSNTFQFSGSKWITNKWIRYLPQVLNFPSTTTHEYSLERLAPLSNDLCSFLPDCKANLDPIPTYSEFITT